MMPTGLVPVPDSVASSLGVPRGLFYKPQAVPGHAPRYDLGEGALYHPDGTVWSAPNGIWNTKLGKIGTIATIAGLGGAGVVGSGVLAGAGAASASALPGTSAGGLAGGASAATAGGAAGGGMASTIGTYGPIIQGGIGALTSIFGSRSANRSNDRAAQLSYDAAMKAAEIQAQGQAQQLAFLKEQEAQRAREWQMTQDRNRAIYDAEVSRDQGRYDDLQARMQPYRQFGVGSLGQLMRPIGG